MKSKIKPLVLVLAISATFSLAGCQSGGGSSGGDSGGGAKTARITLGSAPVNASTRSIQVNNNNADTTGALTITMRSITNFQIYDGTSDTSYCTASTCPLSCTDGQTLAPYHSCYIYVNAKNNTNFNEAALTEAAGLSVTDMSTSQVFTVDLTNTGVLFAGGNNDANIYYTDFNFTTSPYWDLVGYPRDSGNVNVKNIAIDNSGVVFATWLENSNIFSYPVSGGTGNWVSHANPSAVTNVQAFTLSSANDLFVAGSNGHVYGKTETGSFTDLGATGLTQINSIAINNSSGILYAVGDNSNIYEKSSPTAAWVTISTTGTGLTAIKTIAADSVTGDIYIANTDSGKVYELVNGSSTWTDLATVEATGATPLTAIYTLIAQNSTVCASGIGTNPLIYCKTAGQDWINKGGIGGSTSTSVNSLAFGSTLSMTIHSS